MMSYDNYFQTKSREISREFELMQGSYGQGKLEEVRDLSGKGKSGKG